MLTGDQEVAARAVCRQLGIDEYRAQVLPADKSALVEAYRAGGHKVIMVGDGINDSPALAAADVSVAMKDASDLAREVADITLLSSDLRGLAALRLLSQRMLCRIRQNYRLILGFNSALLVLGIAGWLPPSTTALLAQYIHHGHQCRQYAALFAHGEGQPGFGSRKNMEEQRGRSLPPCRKGESMKQHRFWAWAAVICMLMCIYTGKKHK